MWTHFAFLFQDSERDFVVARCLSALIGWSTIIILVRMFRYCNRVGFSRSVAGASASNCSSHLQLIVRRLAGEGLRVFRWSIWGFRTNARALAFLSLRCSGALLEALHSCFVFEAVLPLYPLCKSHVIDSPVAMQFCRCRNLNALVGANLRNRLCFC